ncbi:MAG TPA: ATPase [Candidatus Riflebacteria bacterium]|jgi:predicted AAA+ superfamily ATPase|nr:ATPase [Candidatus Riflebacteria bacterium]
MKRKIERVLVEWKSKKTGRMPLIMNGARQVGKTYILRDFGNRHYKKTVYVNLESNLAVASYFAEDIRPERLLRYLEAYVGHAIVADKTLIIFDEIQSCERALTALKYFCEETPQYHVVAAGSLLGVAINREKFSFPVGKVDSVTLFPLDFEEFLLANGEEMLCREIRDCCDNMQPMPAPLHLKAIDYYRLYLIIGGMPAAINEFIATRKLLTVPDVQNKILNDYLADMAKYASNSDSVKIRACYNSVPAQLAKENRKFQYKIVQKGGSATIFGASIEWLNFAGVLLKCQKIQHATEPIAVYADLSSFKLYMGDVGLLTMKSGISQQTVLSGEPNLFMGAVAENYVAQTLATSGHPLYYWSSEHTAELDFVVQKGNEIIGIEVKKAQQVKSKSLGVFIQKYRPSYSIKLSEKNFALADNNVKMLPLYAAFCI